MSRAGDQSFAWLQHGLPKHVLSSWVYRVMRSENPSLRKQAISLFLRGYKVNMAEAIESDPFAYPSFNAFFTRALRPEARPIAAEPDALVSPVDGTVSQCGTLDDDAILQAKGQNYSLLRLLGGSTERAMRYRGGSFACIYLAPYNYHRIHMPLTGTVRETVYVPGDLFSVNAATARAVPNLFARNERLICDFDIPSAPLANSGSDTKEKRQNIGRFAMVFVGALFVGSMEAIWCGEVNPPPRREKKIVAITKGQGTTLLKGEEAGRFNMGSTVVLLMPRDHVKWTSNLYPGALVRLGERIGTLSV